MEEAFQNIHDEQNSSCNCNEHREGKEEHDKVDAREGHLPEDLSKLRVRRLRAQEAE